MNLTSRRARTLFVLCSVGAVVGAGISATQAYAVGETLAFGPSATSATILNLEPGASLAKAQTAYGLKVTGATTTDPDAMRVQVLSGPSTTGAGVFIEDRANGLAPTNAQVYQPVFGTLTADTIVGATTLTMASTTGFAVNDWVSVQASGTNTEYRKVTATTGTTLTVAALQAAHLTGAVVTNYGATTASTTLAADPAGSATVLTVTSAAAINVNDYVWIGGDTPGHGEFRKVTARVTGGPETITVAAISATTADHVGTEEVVNLGATAGVGLTAAVSAGATTLNVIDSTGITAGDEIVVDGTVPETVMVNTSAAGVVTLVDPLVYAHPLGSYVLDKGAAATGTFLPVPVGGSRKVPAYNVTTNNDSIFLGATIPGTYTLRFYKDRNANGGYDATQDDATPTFTLNVKDVNGTTAAVTDDWAPSVTVPSTLAQGLAVPVTISASGVSTVDTRGANVVTGAGKLGDGIAATIGITFSGNVSSGPTAPTFDGTNFNLSSAATSGTTAEGISITGLGSAAVVRSVPITDNLVATMTASATDVVGSAKLTGAAEAVKTGTATVAYTATVNTLSSGTDKSGKTIYFTLTPGTNTPALSADGTLVSSSLGTKVYSALTNSTGVATLNVTSGTTTAGTTYTVAPATNTAAVTNPTITATYADPAASTFTLTTPSAQMYPTVGGNVALAGTLNDQFLGAFQPPSSAAQQVTVTIDQNAGSYGSADVTAYATLSGGAFTYTYTPSTVATSGRQDVVRFAYTGATNLDSSVFWTSTTGASSVTITTPLASSTQQQQTASAAPAIANPGIPVSGSVLDAGSLGLPYKSVTLTGTAGVYFSTVAAPTTAAADDWTTSITTAANASGVYTAYVFFTKAGTATITATSGTATLTRSVTVSQTADAFTVTATGGTVAPGGNSVVTGTVSNGFGQPVSGATVNLSLGTSTIATLANTSVTTNADGVWSTTVTGASSGSGDATLTATLSAQVANATPHADWLAKAGLTIANGTFQQTATVTVDPTINQTTITGPTSRVGAGYVTLSGTAKPSTSVEIYGKATASSAAYGLVGLVTSGSDGSWSATQYISATSIFFAKTSASTSSTITITVTSAAPAPSRVTVSLRATATGNRHVRLTGDGGPVGRGTLKFYRYTGHGWTLLQTVRANVRGDATIVVTSPRGNQTFRVVYSVTGRGSVGDNESVRVR